jgi:hypothetical protein
VEPEVSQIIPTFNCVHFWDIAKPDGSTWLPGTCRRCGEKKKFRATIPAKPSAKKVIVEEEEDVESLEELAEEEIKGDEW